MVRTQHHCRSVGDNTLRAGPRGRGDGVTTPAGPPAKAVRAVATKRPGQARPSRTLVETSGAGHGGGMSVAAREPSTRDGTTSSTVHPLPLQSMCEFFDFSLAIGVSPAKRSLSKTPRAKRTKSVDLI